MLMRFCFHLLIVAACLQLIAIPFDTVPFADGRLLTTPCGPSSMRRVILRSSYHLLLTSNALVYCRGGPNREISHFSHNDFAQAIL